MQMQKELSQEVQNHEEYQEISQINREKENKLISKYQLKP